MNDSTPLPVDDRLEHERTILLVTYVLYAVEPFTLGVTAVVAVIINHLKVDDTANPFLQSHHRWLLRTFWYTVLWSVICVMSMLTIVLIPLSWLGFMVVGLWHLYRIVYGVLRFIERRPMPV